LKALAAGIVILFAVTALSHFVLDDVVGPSMAGFAAAMTMMIVWWVA